jgi:hypothetical protein
VSSAQQHSFAFWSFTMRPLPSLGSIILSATLASAAFAQAPVAPPHNVVLFVADGLRFRMVDDRTAPTMAAIARDGVTLRNNHALFPTFTTANASSMATGHMLGDTGDFSNTIYAGFEVPGARNSLTPFLENNAILGDIDEYFSGNYLNEATILKLARDKGYSTASIGKIGPALIFDPTERSGNQTVLIDDATGTGRGIPLSPEVTVRLQAVNLPLATPSRGPNGMAGDATKPGTLTANVLQQDYFAARDDESRAADVQGPQQAFCSGVLVARPGRDPAQPRRQPERARSGHQWADIACRYPHCG